MDTNLASRNNSPFPEVQRKLSAAGSSSSKGSKRKRARMDKNEKTNNETVVKPAQRQKRNGKKKKQKNGLNPKPSSQLSQPSQHPTQNPLILKSDQQGTMQNNFNANKKQQQKNNGGIKSNKSNKKNKKPIDCSGKLPTPTPKSRQGIVCVAEDILIQCIHQKRSKTCDELVDVPKEEVNNLPPVPYRDTKKKEVIICDSTAADRAVAEIRAELSIQQRQMSGSHNNSFQYLGFDTESRPQFKKGGGSNPPALLQLATQTTAYLFRLNYQGKSSSTVMTDSLRSLLADTSIIKVGVGVHLDVKELNDVYGPDCCGDGSSYQDLGPLARMRWTKIKRVGLRFLTATTLGYRLSKAQQMKNWEMNTLTPAMEAYAAADAFVALDLLTAIVS